VLPQASRADNLRSDKGRDYIERGAADPSVTFIEFMGVALYLNRRQWPFTALNSWTGSPSPAFSSRQELHLNRRQSRVPVGRYRGEPPGEPPPRALAGVPNPLQRRIAIGN
jgi:hypothetical protein